MGVAVVAASVDPLDKAEEVALYHDIDLDQPMHIEVRDERDEQVFRVAPPLAAIQRALSSDK